jgi:hypothetical protein
MDNLQSTTMEDYVPAAFAEHFNTVPPEVLYHYTGQDGLLGIVGKAELWATKIQYMNDATEFGLALSMAHQELDGMFETSTLSEKKVACSKFKRSLFGLEDINIFAVCFCEEGDLLSQWRGYSGGNQGYSIGFDSNALAQAASRTRFTLGKCIYDRDIQRTIVNQAIAYCLEVELAIPSRAQWGFHGPLADILFRCGAFFKDAMFCEEKEWRLLSPTVTFRDDQLKFRVGRSTILPYYALPISTDGELPIQHIFIAPCPHIDLAKSAVTALLMRHGMLGPLRGQQIAFGSRIPFRNW